MININQVKYLFSSWINQVKSGLEQINFKDFCFKKITKWYYFNKKKNLVWLITDSLIQWLEFFFLKYNYGYYQRNNMVSLKNNYLFS
jgi:hypothetical protein